MELAMRGIQWKTILIYLDDIIIIIISSNVQDLLDRLTEVLRRLLAYGLKLKPGKCRLLQDEVTFLGHVLNGEGIHTNPTPIEAVKRHDPPRTLRDLQVFFFWGGAAVQILPPFRGKLCGNCSST